MAEKVADEEEYSDEEEEECVPKCTPKPKEREHVCPLEINPCTLLGSQPPEADKPDPCRELDPKIRLKRESELACRICPKRSCHDTDMLHPGGKCEEEDPKKKKKK